MPKKFEKRIENIEIIEKFKNNNYYKYRCKCRICGCEFDAFASYIRSNSMYGCQKCKKTKKEEERIEKTKKEYVGKKIGTLEITDIYKKNQCFMAKYRCECGNENDGALSSIISGRIKRCAHKRSESLDTGTRMVESARKENTMIFSHHQKINKNSTTGIKGVSELKNGKYRAYICFKRKQIYLGTFDSLESARGAREKAEKEIFGNFEESYKEKYPAEYAKIKKSLEKAKNKNN